jgi:hypothetical protein
MMSPILDDLRFEFRRTRELADRALEQLSPDVITGPAPGQVNGVGVIVKHVAGNLRSRFTDFLTTDGEKPDRDRESEFVLGPHDTPEHLRERWDAGWAILFDALDDLTDDDLIRTVTVRGEAFTVHQALLRQLGHYAYHVGQLVQLARMSRGEGWTWLSVPPGRSDAFNRNPSPYRR